MDKIDALKNKLHSGGFPKFITNVRFPYFKNLKIGSSINFKFPLTVLVGQNGSGKSSCLQAIQGCPRRSNPSEYWFTTVIDPIKEKDVSGFYPRITKIWPTLVYEYKDNNTYKEVLYQSVYREDYPDYWETRKPSKSYGMTTSERHSPIDMAVIYLDFRSILSAFDKYFYFGTRHLGKIKAKTKQDYLRDKSTRLKNVLKRNYRQKVSSTTRYYNELPTTLTENEIAAINEILGKIYTEATLIRHSFFETEGDSVIFKTSKLNYSEAFAGSGEMAATILVHKVMNAPDNSLVLLDEPEVSLHPLAQEKLKHFLIDQSLKKNLQIIVSTHSASFVNNLPRESIKVFRETPDETFEIIENVSFVDAFNVIGFEIFEKPTILVEDKLSHLVLTKIRARCLSDNPGLAAIEIKHKPGGAQDMFKDIASILRLNKGKNYLFILDGDQKANSFQDIATWTENQINLESLNNHIAEVTQVKKGLFAQDSKMPDDKKIALRRKYINYCRQNVLYLPFNTPEEAIWDENPCRNYLESNGIQEINTVIDKINELTDYKKKFEILAQETKEEITSDQIFNIQEIFVNHWLNNNADMVEEINNSILNKAI